MEGMGAARGRPEPPVRDTLAAEGHRFEFHQAVRLLEMLHALRAGEAPPHAEAVRFRSSASLAFPTSAVEEVRLPENGRDPAEVKVSFLGLAGVLGPLPQPFSELVLERAARGDHALRDFLDVFHHRLVKLLADARRKSRLALQTASPEQGGMAGRLLAVAGMGTEGLQERLQVPDRALLRYAGLLSHHPRSMAGLEGMLREHFGVGVRGVQMVGRWLPLGERQTTRLGRS
ncbi:MAG TPA: type VI secretion system baseplate subunit TssG, partial [Longimicrobiaceae bacterium]